MAAGMWWCEGVSWATERDALEAIRLTLQLGNNVNDANGASRTALHEAADNGWNVVVQFLVDSGC